MADEITYAVECRTGCILILENDGELVGFQGCITVGDIAFYASALNISVVYLSRIVRQISGQTVIDYINQMLLVEASFLLRNTSLTINQIAGRLYFADTSSFSKFYSRLKGMSPRKYRAG